MGKLKNKKVLTIAIDTEYIKMCCMKKNGGNITVIWMATLETPEGTFDDGRIKDYDLIKEKINEGIADKKCPKDVIFTVFASQIISKEIEIPAVKENKILGMLKANSQEYFTYNSSVSEYVYAYTLLDKFTKDKKKMLRIMGVAAPDDIVDGYYQLAKKLNLNVMSLDFVGNSRLQLFKRQVEKEDAMFIQIGSFDTTVSIVKDGVLQLQRTLSYGMHNTLVESVCSEFKVTPEEALKLVADEELLFSRIRPDESEIVRCEKDKLGHRLAITNSVALLINGLRRVVKYYFDQYTKLMQEEKAKQVNADDNESELEKDEAAVTAADSLEETAPIDNIYLITGADRILGLDKLIYNEVGIAVEQLKDLKKVTFRKLKKGEEAPTEVIIDYFDNVGSLLDPVGLISSMQKSQITKKSSSKDSVALIFGSLLIGGMMCGISLYNYNNALERKKAVEDRINEIKSVEGIVDAYYRELDKAEEMMAFVQKTYSDNDSLLYMFNTLERIIPSDTVISSFSVNEGNVSLVATSASKLSVARFLEELDALENVYNVTISGIAESVEDDGQTVDSYSLSFSFKKVYEEDIKADTEEPGGESEDKDSIKASDKTSDAKSKGDTKWKN